MIRCHAHYCRDNIFTVLYHVLKGRLLDSCSQTYSGISMGSAPSRRYSVGCVVQCDSIKFKISLMATTIDCMSIRLDRDLYRGPYQ